MALLHWDAARENDQLEQGAMGEMRLKWWFVLAAVGVLALGIAACGSDDDDDGGGDGGGSVSGEIRIDGSSTLAPLTEAVAESFKEENPDVNVTVGTSGTGGGFEKDRKSVV